MKYLIALSFLFNIIACNQSAKNTDIKALPILLAQREAPLGWVYLKAYADSSFEFVLTGLRDGSIYSGTYTIKADTILFEYSDSVPKLNSSKAVIRNNSIVYLNGSYGEVLGIIKNELSSGITKVTNNTISEGKPQSLSDRNQDVFIKIDRIDNFEKLDTITLENEEFLEHMTDGGGELIGCFFNDELTKIIVIVGLSYGIETSEYYYKSNELFFVRETIELFEFNDSLESLNYEKTEVNFVGEYIFSDDKLVDLESLGHHIIENGEIDIEKTFISEAESYQSLIRLEKK